MEDISNLNYTKQEMQAYAIAKLIQKDQIVIVGTGLPMVCHERELFRDYYEKKKARKAF